MGQLVAVKGQDVDRSDARVGESVQAHLVGEGMDRDQVSQVMAILVGNLTGGEADDIAQGLDAGFAAVVVSAVAAGAGGRAFAGPEVGDADQAKSGRVQIFVKIIRGREKGGDIHHHAGAIGVAGRIR